jgi:hypothetical protein
MAMLVFLLSSSVESKKFTLQKRAGRITGVSGINGRGSGDEEEPLLLSVTEEIDRKATLSSHVSSADQGAATQPSPPATDSQQSAQKGSLTSFFQMSEASRWRVFRLSVLFAADSFAGGMVAGSLLAYYFQVRSFTVANCADFAVKIHRFFT